MIYFGALLAILLVALCGERFAHARARRTIRHRIHVNGIRGKSSVARLIAAGLRGGGLKTWGKVTGTLPIIIDDAGRDIPISRMNGSSLSEQRTVFQLASRARVDALVIECMAIQPQYQRVAQDAFVQATVGVITNVRPDHLESYGDQFESVAHALAQTIPSNGVLLTTPGVALPLFEDVAHKHGSSVVCVDRSAIDERDLEGFAYVEHADNIALALGVCSHLGVSREAALASMLTAIPDPGVLSSFTVRVDSKELHVINALAANDPESTLQLFRRLVADKWRCPVYVLLNSRRDRPLRSIQLGRLVLRMPAAGYFVSGTDVHGVMSSAKEGGADQGLLVSCARMKPDTIAERILADVPSEAVLFAIGNTGAGGLDTIAALAAMGPIGEEE